MITYGTNPGMGIPIGGKVPAPDERHRREGARATWASRRTRRCSVTRSTSCSSAAAPTRGISDLRAAAAVFKGRKVADGVRALVVPGSQQIKAEAEAEGLDRVFLEAGAEWREAGCSMCIAMNGDQLKPGQYAVSTSNRNFEGRQGAGGRTFLASPLDRRGRRGQGLHHRRTGDGLNGKARHHHVTHRQSSRRERRHRSDHPGALPEGDQQDRPRQAPVRRLAVRRRWSGKA